MATRIEPVTVVVSRKVKAGHEADYEAWIREVTGVALKYQGHLGMNVFRPQHAGDPYVLVYKFDSGEHLDVWLNSAERARMVERAEQLSDETHAEHVSGLESWFQLPGAAAVVPPPKWKMALVTGVVVFVLSQTIAPVVRLALGFLPALATAAITTAIMVALITWLVMPQVTKVLRRWLFSTQ